MKYKCTNCDKEGDPINFFDSDPDAKYCNDCYDKELDDELEGKR